MSLVELERYMNKQQIFCVLYSDVSMTLRFIQLVSFRVLDVENFVQVLQFCPGHGKEQNMSTNNFLMFCSEFRDRTGQDFLCMLKPSAWVMHRRYNQHKNGHDKQHSAYLEHLKVTKKTY